jgi:hypothetical protein
MIPKKSVSFNSKLQKYKLLSVFLPQQAIFASRPEITERPE